MSYHEHLALDQERLAGFYEAIQKVEGIIYDIGAGSGIFTVWAVPYANFIYSVEVEPKIAKKTEILLKSFKNVSFILSDALEVEFPQKADFIICEMLDTALIDEEQVPVLNSIIKYLKKNGKVIPHGIINVAEPVYAKTEHICYQEDENPHCQILGPLKVYSQYNFGRYIDPQANYDLHLKIDKNGILTCIKITTFTLITPKIICGPTDMLNPPLIIPTEKIRVKKGDIVNINLTYRMGGGLNTIKTRINGIS